VFDQASDPSDTGIGPDTPQGGDDDKPLDVIAAGDYRRVSRVLAGLEASSAV